MKINDVTEAVKGLMEKGLDPLDLFSWVYLLDLHARYKTYEGVDLDIHYRMQDDIKNALWRKARMLDEAKKTDSHCEMLRHMGLQALTVS